MFLQCSMFFFFFCKCRICSGLPVLSVMAAAQGHAPQVAMHTSILSFYYSVSADFQHPVHTPNTEQGGVEYVKTPTTGIVVVNAVVIIFTSNTCKVL